MGEVARLIRFLRRRFFGGRPNPSTKRRGWPAHRWQQMLENSEHGTPAELASAKRISSGAVSRRARATAPTASESLKRQNHQPKRGRYGQPADEDCPSRQSRSLGPPRHGP